MFADVALRKRKCNNCQRIIQKGEWCLGTLYRSSGWYTNKRWWCQNCLLELAQRPVAGPPGRPRYPSDERRVEQAREARTRRAAERDAIRAAEEALRPPPPRAFEWTIMDEAFPRPTARPQRVHITNLRYGGHEPRATQEPEPSSIIEEESENIEV
jgi:hypothetical protein